MKRLIRKAEETIQYQVGNNVRWKQPKGDESIYTVTQILNDGTLLIDNGINAYTDIKPGAVEPA